MSLEIEDQPLVSVVIPCYNHEHFVQESIRSVIDQDYKNIELIVIDDGSKDGSVEKIKKMIPACEKRFTRFEFRSRSNKGLCETLNESLDWCVGKYFSPIASDDIIFPEKTTIQIEYLEKNNNCVGVFGDVDKINDASKIFKTKKSKNISEKKYNFKDIFFHEYDLPALTQMARISEIKNCGGYKKNIKLEDWYMNLQLTRNGGVLVKLPQKLGLYRIHGSNSINNPSYLHNGRNDILELFSEESNFRIAKSRACIVSAHSYQLTDKFTALKLTLKAFRFSPINLPMKSTLKLILKFFIPKKYLLMYFRGR